MKKLLILFIFSFIFIAACSSQRNGFHHLQRKHPHQLRVVSYNVNWGKGVWKITAPLKTVHTIQKINADIVLLQETTPFWQRYLQQHLRKQYPYQYYHNATDASGLAILAKFPIYQQNFTHPKIGWHPGWIFMANTKIGKIQFANLHLSPPLVSEGKMGFLFKGFFQSRNIRLREIQYYLKLLKPHIPTIIAGDFNENGMGAATNYLVEHGYIDVHKQNGSKSYTWRWETGLIRLYERFDRIYYNRFLQATYIQIIHEGDSDHYPVIVDFKKNK